MINTSNYTRILAIDFGEKRIGLALSDPLKIFAYPYKTLNNDKDFWDKLLKIINEELVEKIILGYPLKESGGKSSSTIKVEAFKEILSAKISLPVILINEIYTSSLAQEKILESVNKKMKRRDKGLIDRNAAAIILQEYLDNQS